MPANECIPEHEPGQRVTGHCTAAVTGKRAVAITGTRHSSGNFSIGPAGAGVKIFGVASFDAGIGKKCPIIRGGIAPVTSGAAVAAGQRVEVDATGRFIPLAAGVPAGYALTTVGAADLDVMVALD